MNGSVQSILSAEGRVADGGLGAGWAGQAPAPGATPGFDAQMGEGCATCICPLPAES